MDNLTKTKGWNVEPTLLASAPTLADISQAIRRFYSGASITLIPLNETMWKLVGTYDSRTRENIRVRLMRRRYRLEMLHA